LSGDSDLPEMQGAPPKAHEGILLQAQVPTLLGIEHLCAISILEERHLLLVEGC
jgi:hypothetical protein